MSETVGQNADNLSRRVAQAHNKLNPDWFSIDLFA
jgi:hypothetical protein